MWNPQDSDGHIPNRTILGPISLIQLGVSFGRRIEVEHSYPQVLFVAPNGEGKRIGLRPGDRIAEVNGQDIGNLECNEFMQLVRSQTEPYYFSIISATLRRVLVTPFNRSRMRRIAMAVDGSTVKSIRYGRYTLLLPDISD